MGTSEKITLDMKKETNKMKKAIIYRRASTNSSKQATSFDIQLVVIEQFCKSYGYEIVKSFEEYMSGTITERPEFNKALDYAVANDCVIVSYRADRISRRLNIFSKIENHLHRFRFAELGDVVPNLIVLGVLFACAENEARAISARVKAGMALSKSRGNKMGNPNMKEVQKIGSVVMKANAAEFNQRIIKIVSDLKAAGYTSNKELLDKLNDYGVKTRRGNRFTYKNLLRVLKTST